MLFIAFEAIRHYFLIPFEQDTALESKSPGSLVEFNFNAAPAFIAGPLHNNRTFRAVVREYPFQRIQTDQAHFHPNSPKITILSSLCAKFFPYVLQKFHNCQMNCKSLSDNSHTLDLGIGKQSRTRRTPNI